MKYSELIDSHKKYGTCEEDIINKEGYQEILENVVIAPWWSHEIFSNYRVENINDKVFNIYGDDFSFSYIELKAIGAPVIIDDLLALGVTKCKNLIFIGSVGALDESFNIGDIVVPEYSICGDGASRYLNEMLEDEFGKKEYPNKYLYNKLLKVLENYNYKTCINYSVDTVFAQFKHIDYIKSLGCNTIEMETACLFKTCEMTGINAVALLSVSDNTLKNKSLYSGRTESEQLYRRKVRNEIIPNIIIDLFKSV